ncbi:MAG: glycogen debranching N-terminal domain-containing protein [Actinomycetota bacterium]|nr:glycogen debranching N-terminal domain-containing protein [Actinomycetota bacterium]
MNVTISEGMSFLISDELGNIVPDSEDGLYGEDYRYLSRYDLSINGRKPLIMTGRQVDYYSAVHYLQLPQIDDIDANTVSIARKRFVGNGLHEDIEIVNSSRESVRFDLRLEFEADFAHIFEVKSGKRPKEKAYKVLSDQKAASISLIHDTKNGYFETRIIFNKAPLFDYQAAVFTVSLESQQSWHLCVDFMTLLSGEEKKPKYGCGTPAQTAKQSPEYRADWIQRAPKLFSDYDTLQHAYDQSIFDMAALRLKGSRVGKIGIVPAAGIPWYDTCFGRDSIIAAYQTLPYLPDLAYGVLRNLAAYQGAKVDPEIEEEPGKILHEIRWSGVTPAGETNHSVYYGTIDATLLYIILLSELYKWTADKGIVEELKDNLIKATEWIDRYGDKDDDGYIEYARSGDTGLENQGWKDSWDSVRFADGRFAEAPIALCEVQGYAYMAKLAAAELTEVLGKGSEAERLRASARKLKTAFDKDFWMEKEGFFAEALDKNKEKVDSITSNPGQLLWTGIVDGDKADIVRKRLFAPDMFSGWGIRTMSSSMAAYNAMSYHNGSVWPHDNAFIMKGLVDYGFHDDALRVIDAVLDAGQYFPFQRLPELFCGFDRESSRIPIDYPAASSPQAWASGAPMLMLTAMLGMKANADEKILILNPGFPADIYRIFLSGVHIGGTRLGFEVLLERGEPNINILENPGSFKIRLEGRH